MQTFHTRKSYGPPRRPVSKSYSSRLESVENYQNRIIVNEYMGTITQHLRVLEKESSVNPSMIDLQPEVKWYMRPYLVNFIIQMHSSLKLKPQTLFLCWNIIDRYCAKRIAFKQHYQLIGCTALWIASKYEDKKSRVPTVKELNTMCSNVYDDSMFREMEIHILSTLNWSIGHTTLEDILQLAVKSSDPDGKEQLNQPIQLYKGNTPTVSAILAVSRFLCELSLYDRNYLKFSTSAIGITCFLMSCSILNMDVGTNYISQLIESFEKKSSNLFTYKEDDLTEDEDESFFYEAAVKENQNNFSNGPFINGFDGHESLNEIRMISLNLFKSMLDPSNVLIEKYTSLGVMTVVKRFIQENNLHQVDQSLIDQDIEEPVNNDMTNMAYSFSHTSFELTNLLLSFNENCSFLLPKVHRNISITSSGDSIFGTPCESPSNFSSFSSISSATSYYSDSALNSDLKSNLI
ncbi:hypothetical protein CAS74_001411 [Pichia kudriavzevii]|uniref:Cyclin-like domain-containing protein n=1 Tax=Pichia kudriavzevii TaxID=4909 RepID=A0A099P6R9_PICKU|nr:hypothetical protein JL09_g863 [Pichia kudriavzevii]OUT23103.1 hypothetical protein CAS74_001411 [Pichia kudriavzevii]